MWALYFLLLVSVFYSAVALIPLKNFTEAINDIIRLNLCKCMIIFIITGITAIFSSFFFLYALLFLWNIYLQIIFDDSYLRPLLLLLLPDGILRHFFQINFIVDHSTGLGPDDSSGFPMLQSLTWQARWLKWALTLTLSRPVTKWCRCSPSWWALTSHYIIASYFSQSIEICVNQLF